ncbi:DUF2252 family protein [Caballeronia telluris]|uniref:DUF2252 family protein n=1 Tax=Caballeronia telluris TaxID=326475 RepID=UPI000B3E5B92
MSDHFRDKEIASWRRLKARNESGDVAVLDAAYWVRGCSSLGRTRYAVLPDVSFAVRATSRLYGGADNAPHASFSTGCVAIRLAILSASSHS